MSRNGVDHCKSGRQFVATVDAAHKYDKRRQSGSHVTYETPQGRVTIADHNRELPGWLRVKIAAAIVAIGLISVVAFYILTNYTL